MAAVFLRDGQYWKQTDVGESPLTADEMSRLQLKYGDQRMPTKAVSKAAPSIPADPEKASTSEVLNEMGVTLGQRVYMKTFLNPESAKEYLTSYGYQIKPYGTGFNFAVRKNDGEPWRVIDPEPGLTRTFQPTTRPTVGLKQKLLYGPSLPTPEAIKEGEWGRFKEFMMDILDLTSDIGIGVATTALTGGGSLPLQIGRGALAAGGLETARQGIGAVTGGGAGNISPAAIGINAAVGGAAPAAGSAIHWMFDKATGGLLTLGARAVGIGGKTGTPLVPGAVLSERGGIKGFGALEDYDTAVRKIRDIVETVGDRHTNPFPETLAADDIAKQAEQAGGTIDLSKVVEYIDGLVKAPVQVGKTVSMRAKSAKAASLQFRDRGLSAEMKNVLEGMYDIADKNGVASLASAPAPIGFSIALKRDLQAKAAGEGGYGATQAILGQESRDALETAARMINQEVRSALKATGLQSPDGRTYDKLMDVVSKKTEVLKYWKKGLNRGATEADRHNNAVSLISGVFNKSKGGTHEFAVNFDKYFGTDITSLMKRPIIGEAFGEQGAASIMPRMTATGLPMGSALLGGMLGGSKGHPVAGAIAGGAIASPMSVLAMTKAGQALAKFGSGPAGALAGASPATRSALLAATQELSRRFTPEMP